MTDCNACTACTAPELTDDEFWDEEQEEGKQEFKVVSDMMAEWCIKKIKQETADHDRLVEIAKAEIEELNRQITLLDKALENRTGYLKSKLWEYFQTVGHKETKTQETYKLLTGSLVFKKPSQKIVKVDDKQLLDFLHEYQYEEFVETVEKPKWGEFKKELSIQDGKVVTQDGMILDDDTVAIENVAGEFGVKI